MLTLATRDLLATPQEQLDLLVVFVVLGLEVSFRIYSQRIC